MQLGIFSLAPPIESAEHCQPQCKWSDSGRFCQVTSKVHFFICSCANVWGHYMRATTCLCQRFVVSVDKQACVPAFIRLDHSSAFITFPAWLTFNFVFGMYLIENCINENISLSIYLCKIFWFFRNPPSCTYCNAGAVATNNGSRVFSRIRLLISMSVLSI